MKKRVLTIFLLLSAVEGLITAFLIFNQRSDQAIYYLNSGFTAKNFLLLVFVLCISAAAFVVSFLNHRSNNLLENVQTFIEPDQNFFGIILISFFVLVECTWDIIFLRANIPSGYYYDYIQLLKSILPVLVLGIFFSLQLILVVLIIRQVKPFSIKNMNFKKSPEKLVFAGLLLVLGFFKVVGSGYISFSNRTAVSTIFGDLSPTGPPLIHEQVVIITILIIIIAYCVYRFSKNRPNFPPIRSDIILATLLWIGAYLLWSSIPIEGNWYIDISTSPISTVYPSSDAFYYDKEAFNVLLTGEFLDNTTHVMYSFFVMLLHLIGGNEFLGFINLQVATLALIPVVLFKFTSYLSSKIAGFLVGVLFIIRERNGLLLAGDINGSLVNQLMTENLAILCLIVYLLIIVIWLENTDKKNLPYLAGGLIGVSLLIRSEFLAVLIAVSGAALIHLWNRKPDWFRGMIKMWIIALIIITPWMGRNLARFGTFSLDKAGFFEKTLKGYFNGLSYTLDEGAQDNLQNDPMEDYFTSARSAHKPNLHTFSNHLASSTLESIIYLPSSHQPLFTIFELTPYQYQNEIPDSGLFSEKYIDRYVRSLPYFWYRWDGRIEPRSYYSIFETLVLISIGVALLWKFRRKSFLVLPAVFIAIIFIWAWAGYSGGRFTKTADWITLVYYGIGLSVLIGFLWQKFNPGSGFLANMSEIREFSRTRKYVTSNDWVIGIGTIGLILLGLSPIVAELALPTQYSKGILVDAMKEISLESDNADDLMNEKFANEILNNPQEPIYGKALYPRYFERGETLPDDRRGTIPPADLNRFDFYIVGTENYWISLPLDNPEHLFPHYTDVVIFGTLKRTANFELRQGYLPYVQADLVYVIGDDGNIRKFPCNGSECSQNNGE